jgi:hypothetical protein
MHWLALAKNNWINEYYVEFYPIYGTVRYHQVNAVSISKVLNELLLSGHITKWSDEELELQILAGTLPEFTLKDICKNKIIGICCITDEHWDYVINYFGGNNNIY